MNDPVVVQGQLTRWDFFANTLYYWRRKILSWVGWLVISAIFIFVIPDIISHRQIILNDLLRIAVTMMLMALAFFVLMFFCTLMTLRRIKPRTLNRMIVTSFMEDGLRVDCEGNYSFTKYGELEGIFIYKKHIIMQYITNACSVVPWRSVPASRQEELKLFLQNIKEKVKR